MNQSVVQIIKIFSNSSQPFLYRSTAYLFRQSIRYKFKRFGDRPVGESLKILDREYRTDEWTNIPNKVIDLIERPDPLYKTLGNPIYLIAESLRQHYNDFECFHYPDPVVTTWQNFDSILVPSNHVSRSKADTFYVDRQHVLRSHTSAHQSECFKHLKNVANQASYDPKFMIIGDVYRRDEVNRTHHAAFHQAEIVQLYSEQHCRMTTSLFDESNKNRTNYCQERHNLDAIRIVENELKSQVESYIHLLFDSKDGDPIQMRWIPAYFPFTHPSWELEIQLPRKNFTDGDNEDLDNSEWLEMLGCGIVEQSILDRDGHSNRIGWALGFGLERLAMLYYSIPDIRLFWTRDTGFSVQFDRLKPFERYQYQTISTYPQKIFDISFWLPLECVEWSANDVHAIILEIGGHLVEQAHLMDEWIRPKDGRRSNCYRIVYRSHERALTNDEVNLIHHRIEETLVKELNVEIR
ncbi:phenylalanyl-tRNA synthetase, mitochondrial [Dermatophagoides farinae]|uniref:phenylalanine--tRNA ligase n=1 Tax=Dermatophagoides farinae TaxID=6954 RepID=A0A922I8E0_DERFA|nr:Phenylalanyl-tRNA synthetase [Dermatophagoides farinae]